MRTRVIRAMCLILCLNLLALQSGCGISDTADTSGGATGTGDIRLSLTTPSGFTGVVADGRSTIPLRMLVTNTAGAGVPNVPVTFATTAGTLSEAPVVRATRAVDAADGAATARQEAGERLTVSTNAEGVAQVLLTASTRTGTALVTADVQGFRSNITIVFVAGAATRVQVNANPSSVNAGAAATVTATVTDANGNPVPDVAVDFALSTNTSGATLSTMRLETDAAGQATVMYMAGFIAGADTVRAQVTSGVVGMTSITVAPAPAGLVTAVDVAAGAANLVADGTSSIVIRATVTGAMGPVPGVPVAFTATAGSLSAPTAITDRNGVAVVSLIAATSLGTTTVAASAEGVTDTATVTFVAGRPATVTLNATPPVLNARATAMVQATVTDANGNPAAGQTLVFSLPTNASGATLSALTGTTNANGQFTVTYTAGASLGTDIVQARTTNGATGSTSITVAVQSGGVAAVSVTSGTPTLVANGMDSATIRATVSDAMMAGVPGVPVTFSTTAGTLSAMTATTDNSGVATVILTAGTTIGTATVTATAGGVRSTTTVMFTAGPPVSEGVVLSATPSRVSRGATSVIRVTVTDANGNPAALQTLTLGFVTNASGASLSALTGMTDVNGQLTVTYTAGTTLGADVVRAQTTSGATGMVTITVAEQATNVSAVNIEAGSMTLVANGTSTVTIRATVTDAMGAPLSGVDVTFSTTAGTLSSPTAPTDENGVATVSLRAGTNLGTATVTADADGFSSSVTVMFIAGPPAPGMVSLQPASTTVNVGGTTTIQVTVRDANGNPTAMQALTMSLSTNVSGATLTPLTGTTDANGQLTLTYTAGQTPGTDVVRALTVNGVAGTVSIMVTLLAGASDIDLLVSSPQLDSGGSDSVTLTALVRDASNNVVSGAAVNFTANSGGIQVVRGITDVTGTATALLTTGGDPTNRIITVTATTGTLPAVMNAVEVTGTTLTLGGATSAVLNSVVPLSLILRDSAGVGIPNRTVMITVSRQGTVLSTTSVTTDFTGAQTVNVTASPAGTLTIRADALGAADTTTLDVSGDNFVLRIPDLADPSMSTTTLDLGTVYTVMVQWQRNNMNIPDGSTVDFSTTRGILSAPSAMTVNGIATVTINSVEAGSAVISAVGVDPNESPSSQLNVQFRATMPSAMLLQAMPTTLGVNAAGSMAQQSVITAIVQDANGNLVADREVRFSLTDTTGGTIFPASRDTDDFGRASIIYTAGAVPSAQEGVIIQATVTGTNVVRQVRLTVAQQALFVTLGTGNLIMTPSSTQYAQPYTVLVTDVNGNPVANARVELTVIPGQYQKGQYMRAFDMMTGTCTGTWFLDPAQLVVCPNEDANLNGILDTAPIDEDLNMNGRLDPGNVASVPGSVTTDATGFATFDVVYARQFATWVQVALQARATVAGSEGLSQATFFLPILASDLANCNVSPPGRQSPYGIAATCDNPN